VSASEPTAEPSLDPETDGAFRAPRPRRENPIVGWARAIVLGVRDTAEDMLDEGRRGAHDAYEEGWQRFDKKTKYRSNRKH
jgi:hypothetical protein